MPALDLAQVVALAREEFERGIGERLVFLFQADTHEGLEELADGHAVARGDGILGGREDLGLAEGTILGEQLAHAGVAVRGDLVARLGTDAQLARAQKASHAGAHQIGRVAVGRAHEGRDERLAGQAAGLSDFILDAAGMLALAGGHVLAVIQRQDAKRIVQELGRRAVQLGFEELQDLGVGHGDHLGGVGIEIRQHAIGRGEQGRAEGGAQIVGPDLLAAEVEVALVESGGHGLAGCALQLFQAGFFLEHQALLGARQGGPARFVALDHLLRAEQIPGGILEAAIADHPDQAIPERLLRTPLDPVGGLAFALLQAKIHGEGRILAGVYQLGVAGLTAVRVPQCPRERCGPCNGGALAVRRQGS